MLRKNRDLKPEWEYKKANLDDAVAASDDKFAAILNAMETNMKGFEARGGKLIIYHGWSDPGISPLNTINFYESVVNKCGGGPGPDVFGGEYGISPVSDPQHNIYLALEQWVEKGTAPSTVIASKTDGEGPAAKVKMTRPLCPYPLEAIYKGSGDTNTAANFVCEKEK